MNARANNADLAVVPAVFPVDVEAGDNSGDALTGASVPMSSVYFYLDEPGALPASGLASIFATVNVTDGESATLAAQLQDSADGTNWADVDGGDAEYTRDGPQENQPIVLEIPFQPGSLRSYFRVVPTLTLTHEPGEEDTPDSGKVSGAFAFTGFGKMPAPSVATIFNTSGEE